MKSPLHQIFLCVLSLGLLISDAIFAQPATGSRASLPPAIAPQSLTGLEVPPQFVQTPKSALPSDPALSNVSGNLNSNTLANQTSDLIRLYQDAAFSDPVLNAARFNYQASKELYWQGLSLLLPQASATPGGTRYYRHGIIVQASLFL